MPRYAAFLLASNVTEQQQNTNNPVPYFLTRIQYNSRPVPRFLKPPFMIDYSVLPVYVTAVLALLLIPGPDMLLITSASLSYGKRVGIFASLGNATSGIILTLLAAAGISALIAVSPTALTLLKLVGGAYLLKMGWDCLRTAAAGEAETLHAEDHLARKLYRRAVFSNLLNPKLCCFLCFSCRNLFPPK